MDFLTILSKTATAAAATALLAGCYRVYDHDIDVTPVLCINSIITAGQPVEVSVTRTWKYTDCLDEADRKVTDAVVEIYANGQLQESGYLPAEGDRIRIVASSPSYGCAEGEVCVPVSVPIESITWTTSELERGRNVISFNLDALLTILDDNAQDNYYQIAFSEVYNPGSGNDDEWKAATPHSIFTAGTLNYEAEPIFGEHIDMLDKLTGMDSYNFCYFTDRSFPGDRYTLNLHFDEMSLTNFRRGSSDPADWSIRFSLFTISRSLYNLVNYQWHTHDTLQSDMADNGLSDPIWGYSNVSTGAGVIAAQSSATAAIDLHEFLSDAVAGL